MVMECFLSVFNQFFNTWGYPRFIGLMPLHSYRREYTINGFRKVR